MLRLFRFAVIAVVALAPLTHDLDAQGRRIVAIGDVHGAHEQFVAILMHTGLIDATQRWTGGATTLVQTGDYTDRGAKVRDVLDLLIAIEERARAGGGMAITLLGNHEMLNLLGEMRDVTPEICVAFADSKSEARREASWTQYQALALSRAKARQAAAAVYQQTRDAWMASHPLGCLEYREALGARGQYGKWLRTKSIATTVDGTLFMHAGINPD
nr:metallophosphoesterase [Acidobacteriota bacterium]